MNTDIFKEKLLAEKAEVEKSLGEIAGENVQGSGDWEVKAHDESVNEADPIEVADKIEDRIEDNAIVEELEDKLKDINDALKKIEGGTYGTDEVDGEMIPEDRLMANPAARTKIENVDKL